MSRGLSCLAAQQGGVSQIRGSAPNPACWVLQGSEQLIMNLIKGEQEPQSDLGFSLGHHSAQMAWLCMEQVGCHTYSPPARAAGAGVGGQAGVNSPSPAYVSPMLPL